MRFKDYSIKGWANDSLPCWWGRGMWVRSPEEAECYADKTEAKRVADSIHADTTVDGETCGVVRVGVVTFWSKA